MCTYFIKKETPGEKEKSMDPVNIGNPYSDPKQGLWEVENYQKKVVSFIKYSCALKYGTDIGKSRYEGAISTGTINGYLGGNQKR